MVVEVDAQTQLCFGPFTVSRSLSGAESSHIRWLVSHVITVIFTHDVWKTPSGTTLLERLNPVWFEEMNRRRREVYLYRTQMTNFVTNVSPGVCERSDISVPACNR